MTVLDESTADCFAVDRACLRRRRVGWRRRSFAAADVASHRRDGRQEDGALSGLENGTRLPEFVGRRTVRSARTSGGVRFHLREGDVVVGPQAGTAGDCRVSFGPSFQRADARFNGPIVPWRIGR
jgi:hypothetical protein